MFITEWGTSGFTTPAGYTDTDEDDLLEYQINDRMVKATWATVLSTNRALVYVAGLKGWNQVFAAIVRAFYRRTIAWQPTALSIFSTNLSYDYVGDTGVRYSYFPDRSGGDVDGPRNYAALLAIGTGAAGNPLFPCLSYPFPSTFFETSPKPGLRQIVDILRGLAGRATFSWPTDLPTVLPSTATAEQLNTNSPLIKFSHLEAFRTALAFDGYSKYIEARVDPVYKGTSLYTVGLGGTEAVPEATFYGDYSSGPVIIAGSGTPGVFNNAAAQIGTTRQTVNTDEDPTVFITRVRAYFKIILPDEIGTLTRITIRAPIWISRYNWPGFATPDYAFPWVGGVYCLLNTTGIPLTGNNTPTADDVIVHIFDGSGTNYGSGNMITLDISDFEGLLTDGGELVFTLMSANDYNNTIVEDISDFYKDMGGIVGTARSTTPGNSGSPGHTIGNAMEMDFAEGV